jgi:peptidoglycan hydrolase CwlO-like protein
MATVTSMNQNENLSDVLRQRRLEMPPGTPGNQDEAGDAHRAARREAFERLHQERQEARHNARRRLLGLRVQPDISPAPVAVATPLEPATPRLDQLDGQLAALDARVETLDGYVPKIDSNFVKLDSQISTIDGQILNLERHGVKADRQVSGLDNRVGQLDSEVSRIGGQLTQLEQQIGSLDGEVTASLATYDERLGRLEQDFGLLHDQPAAPAESDPRVSAMESDVQAMRDRIGELASQISPFDEQFDQIRAELRRLDESLDSFGGDAAQTGDRSASMDADFNRLATLVEVVAGELKRMQDRVESGNQERLAAHQETLQSVGGLDHRLATVEVALLRVTQQVEASAIPTAPDSDLHQRLEEMEGALSQLLRVVEQMQVERAAERADRLILASRASHSDDEAGEPANSAGPLASLTKLITGLKPRDKRDKPEEVSHD